MSADQTKPGHNVTIGNRVRIPSPLPERAGKFDLIIPYSTDTGIRSTVTIPEETISDANIKKAVQDDIAKAQKTAGLKFKVP